MPDFIRAHMKAINSMALQLQPGDVFRVAPKTPLSEIEYDFESLIEFNLVKGSEHDVIELIEMRVTEPRPGIRSAEPLDKRSERLIRDWTSKYGDWSEEEFNWTPAL